MTAGETCQQPAHKRAPTSVVRNSERQARYVRLRNRSLCEHRINCIKTTVRPVPTERRPSCLCLSLSLWESSPASFTRSLTFSYPGKMPLNRSVPLP